MTKRGYKLQEFLAHSGNVNCLSIGKKTSRLLLTGGDDSKVNLWAIGKPTSLMSLCGHTCPVDSVAFNSTEALVLAGASSGVIKLWNLEEEKMVRAFTGHRSNCSAVEFHPFGEYLASGSNDTNLKIWDIRKKGSIQTYKGHTRGIGIIKFSPDGRWVVSGGLDNVVKVWDLTAGKLLHEFTFHEGPIRSLDFHPLEFLLATGSADRTVKFWDMETFELIGSTRPEATGVRSISFHPDGRTLFCGLDDGLKVYSWEPMICHDGVDMGWSTLGDFSINEGKFIGCSYYRNSIGIWVSDISQLEPYGVGSEDKNEGVVKRFSVSGQSSERVGSGSRSSSSPDYETKEIKNIYVDSIGGNFTVAQNSGSLKVTLPSELGKVANIASEHATHFGQPGDKSSIMHGAISRDSDSGEESSHPGRESVSFSKTKPGMLLRPAHVRKTLARFEESNQSVVVQSGTRKKSLLDVEEELQTQNATHSEPPTEEANRVLHKPAHAQRSSNSKYNESRRATSVDSCSSDDIKDGLGQRRDIDLPIGRNSCKEDISNKHSSSQTERVSPEKSGDEQKNTEYPGGSREENPVKIVGGVKVVSGRTRSLVEKFERGEKATPTEAASTTITQNTNVVQEDPRKTSTQTGETPVISTRRARSTPARVMPIILNRDSTVTSDAPPVTQPSRNSSVPVILNQASNVTYDEPCVTGKKQARTSPARMIPRTLSQTTNNESDEASVMSSGQRRTSSARVRPVSFSQAMTSHESLVTSTRPARTSPARVMRAENMPSHECLVTSTRPARTSPARVMRAENMTSHECLVTSTRPARTSPARVMPADNMASHESLVPSRRPARTSPARVMRADNTASHECLVTSTRPARTSPARVTRADNMTSDTSHKASTHRASQMLVTSTVTDHVANMTLGETQTQPACDILTQKEEPQVSGRENDSDITESIMKTHDEFLTTLQSRLTKLQIVRHYWERSDVKGAIGALRKLTDQSVQTDVISILTDKIEILTLDMFSQLVPVLTGLLGSRTERAVNVSLEMLLKLVAVFGSVIRSTVSAPRIVGVDLHADERLQICQICSAGLHKIQRILPVLARRGGLITRKAQELNLVLQEP